MIGEKYFNNLWLLLSLISSLFFIFFDGFFKGDSACNRFFVQLKLLSFLILLLVLLLELLLLPHIVKKFSLSESWRSFAKWKSMWSGKSHTKSRLPHRSQLIKSSIDDDDDDDDARARSSSWRRWKRLLLLRWFDRSRSIVDLWLQFVLLSFFALFDVEDLEGSAEEVTDVVGGLSDRLVVLAETVLVFTPRRGCSSSGRVGGPVTVDEATRAFAKNESIAFIKGFFSRFDFSSLFRWFFKDVGVCLGTRELLLPIVTLVVAELGLVSSVWIFSLKDEKYFEMSGFFGFEEIAVLLMLLLLLLMLLLVLVLLLFEATMSQNEASSDNTSEDDVDIRDLFTMLLLKTLFCFENELAIDLFPPVSTNLPQDKWRLMIAGDL